MSNDKFIVITSINGPTDAVCEFAKWSGWNTVVVGDRKSPRNWACDGVTFLSIDAQRSEFPKLSGLVPENTYVRKMFGYLHAMRRGAKAIFETDDDNIPYPGAQDVVEQDLTGGHAHVPSVRSDGGWVNVYPEFGAKTCWPRGYPLHALNDPRMSVREGREVLPWGILQYLADEDPDVDAIFRMTRSEPVYFARNRTLRLDKGSYSPFNSQATLWLEEFFPLLFLPVGISDRVTDILRGYMALSCLWRNERTLRFSSPVVYQKRNAHNLLSDFEQEIDLYRHGDRWSKLLLGVAGDTPENAFRSAVNMLIRERAIPDVNDVAYQAFIDEVHVGGSA